MRELTAQEKPHAITDIHSNNKDLTLKENAKVLNRTGLETTMYIILDHFHNRG